MIPDELMAKAVILAKEPAWVPGDALEVVAWLAKANIAVVGAESLQEERGSPKWLASSNYQYDQSAGWGTYVKQCSEGASNFIRRFQDTPGVLFNLVWVKKGERRSEGDDVERGKGVGGV